MLSRWNYIAHDLTSQVINALISLHHATPPRLQPPGDAPSSRDVDLTHSPTHVLDRGDALFAQIYSKVAPRVSSQMSLACPDLYITARIMYGYLLSGGSETLGTGDIRSSTPGQSEMEDDPELMILKRTDKAETSFVLIAGLVPQDVNPQLKGHLKGALNCGADVEEVRAVRRLVVSICEDVGMRTVDGCDGRERSIGGWSEPVADL